MLKTLTQTLLLAGLAWSTAALGQWELDSESSSITFISVKNEKIAEQHRFDALSGSVSAKGRAQVDIELDSVETLIPIRNERMREMLFETASYPLAQLSAAVEPAVLESVMDGGVVNTEVPVTVKLHGVEKSVTARVAVVGEAGTLRVIAAEPVVISAADFGLEGGVDALRQVAGLNSIVTAVPVSFQLVFTAAE